MYQPKPPPFNADAKALAQYVYDELNAVAQAGGDTQDFVQLNVLHRDIGKTRAGMIVFCDGSDLDLGSGQGVYRRNADNSAWVLLGSGGTTDISGAWPVGSIFVSVSSTNPATSLGFGTWSAFGAGRVLIGRDSGDTDFDTAEETGGAKTVASAGTVAAPTISGSTAAEASHTHSVTSNVTVADHSSHTHTYTEVPNHVHVQNMPSGFTGGSAYMATDTSVNGSTASYLSTANPTGGVATGTTNGPNATLTHSPTNNAVTSAAGSSHSHGAGTLAASAPAFTGSATSVVQPYIVVYMFKRTA